MKQVKVLNAQHFKKMVEYGVLNLKKHYKEVNDLNVFPVPDGDTGINMRRTIETGYDVIKDSTDDSISKLSQDLSRGMLLGARGNSGVILSQIFRGLAEGFQNKKYVTVIGLTFAFNQAVRKAYTSVVNPVEGTILTVLREAVKFANSKLSNLEINKYIEVLYKKAKSTLPKTKSMLPVLKEAGVVDSGGAGLLYIFEGFHMYFQDMPIDVEFESNVSLADQMHDKKPDTLDLSLFNEYSVLDYGYCTEFILQLSASKVDVETFDEQIVIDYLKTLGDSIVCFKEGTVIKVHVHTKDPGTVYTHVRQWGEFLTLKCENMSLQHNNVVAKKEKKHYKIKKNKIIIAVCQGEGMREAFEEAGVDVVIDGGQTMNPSSEDFVEALKNIEAEYIYILPNNSNIFLAAQQARDLYAEENPNSNIYVLKTKSVAAGYIVSNLIALNDTNGDELVEEINDQLSYVKSFELTKATKNTQIFGINVKKEDYIGLIAGKLVEDNNNKIYCLMDTLKHAEDIEDYENILLIYGSDVKYPEKKRIADLIKRNFPNMQITEIDGGQAVYSVIGCLS